MSAAAATPAASCCGCCIFTPQVEVAQITSREHAGRYIHSVHPNLRGISTLKFIHPDALQECDLLFLALPHGTAARSIERYAGLAPKLIDLSADFRLDSAAAYERWYGEAHPAPEWLGRFVYGLPEFNRERLLRRGLRQRRRLQRHCGQPRPQPAGPSGHPSTRRHRNQSGIVRGRQQEQCRLASPVRSGAVRTYKATGHRHLAEVQMILGCDLPIDFAVTAIEMVRGVHLLAHCYLENSVAERDIWRLYRGEYRGEPFVRLVSGKVGLHRLPEPRVVAGTNYCDIGFELDDDGQHLVVIAALDNLGKGAAGSAVQSMNLMYQFDEKAGLEFPGIYP